MPALARLEFCFLLIPIDILHQFAFYLDCIVFIYFLKAALKKKKKPLLVAFWFIMSEQLASFSVTGALLFEDRLYGDVESLFLSKYDNYVLMN